MPDPKHFPPNVLVLTNTSLDTLHITTVESFESYPKNYRPISLLSVLGKMFEADSLIALNLSASARQQAIRSSDKQVSSGLTAPHDHYLALDRGKDTFVKALDIAGAFDREWHLGLAPKLNSMGVRGDLLRLMQDSLRRWSLKVAVDGRPSEENPTGARVVSSAHSPGTSF
nr:uncharacterized protein LOC113824213 [Penaeus vannamei]